MESIAEPNPYRQPQSSTSAKKCLSANNSQSKPADEALLKNVVPSASQKPTAFRQQPDQFACNSSWNELDTKEDIVNSHPRPFVQKVFFVGTESHSFLGQLIDSLASADNQQQGDEIKQGKVQLGSGAVSVGPSHFPFNRPAVELSQNDFTTLSGDVSVKTWLSAHLDALGFQFWSFKGRETLHELVFTANALFVVVLDLDQPQKELQKEAGFWLDAITKSAPGAATLMVANDMAESKPSMLLEGFRNLDGFVSNKAFHQRSAQRGSDSESGCTLVSVVSSEPGTTKESYLQLVGGQIEKAAARKVEDGTLKQEYLSACDLLISDEDKERLVLAERLRQLLAAAKTVDLRSTPSPRDPSEHALRQMQIKYRTQGIMTIDLLSSVIRAAGTGACISSMESSDQAAQLIKRLSEAGLAHQMPSQGQSQGHFAQYIIPSAWNPLDQQALEGRWPLPLAKAFPREWLLGWYFYSDKYDVPGNFFERLIGQSVQHDGHNKDNSRVLYWSRGATMYRNKVQVLILMIDRDDKGNSPCLLLVGRLVRKERPIAQLREGSERRAIWTELKPYFIEASELLKAEYPEYPVRLEALCPKSAWTLAKAEAGRTAGVLEHLQSLHSVAYPGASEGLVAFHDLRTLGCKVLKSIPCECCQASLEVDWLAPPDTAPPKAEAQSILARRGRDSPSELKVDAAQESGSPTSSLNSEGSKSSLAWSDKSSTPPGSILSEGSFPFSPLGDRRQRAETFPSFQGFSPLSSQSSPGTEQPVTTEGEVNVRQNTGSASRPATPGEEATRSASGRRLDARRCPAFLWAAQAVQGHAEYRDVLNLQDERLRGEVADVLVQRTSSPAGGETVQEERNPPQSAPESIPKGSESSTRAVDNPTLLGERMNHGLVKNWEFKDEKTVCEGLTGGATVHDGRLKLKRCESRATSQSLTGRVTSSMSFEVAVQLSDTEASVALMTLRKTDPPPALVSLILDASHWAVELSGVPWRFDKSPEEDTGVPIHLVMVVRGQSKTCTVKCYRNGVRLGGQIQHQAPAFGPDINKQLVLGNHSECKEKVFAPSEIFFARLYNQELESDEVEALYCAFEEEFRENVV